ncbi:MAG: NOP5/NOP56 family protein [Candidatus Micrarchaeota archaeon]
MENSTITSSNKRDLFVKKSRLAVTEALKSRDMLLVGVTRTLDDLDKTINLLNERLQDWYGVYFPELKVEEPQKYAQVVLGFDKETPDLEFLKGIVGDNRAHDLVNRSQRSLGAKISATDLGACRMLAQQVTDMYSLREKYQKYQQELTEDICPNIAYITGYMLAAKLITHIGSIKRFAILPASTIQVLGAEKALFKHLKNRRIAPPKHGLIFQFPQLGSAPKRVRGKIARALANKISLAAKADAFTKNFIAEQIKKDFEVRMKQIMEESKGEKKVKEGAIKYITEDEAEGNKQEGGRGGGNRGGNRGGFRRNDRKGGRR